MRRAAFLVCLAALLAAPAGAQLTGYPLQGLERLKNFEAMRASSCSPNWNHSNNDARAINPGQTLTLADLHGPGSIVHFWCTARHPVESSSRLLTLRMYWDGEARPSVECPLGDFFGVGHGVDVDFTSLPVRCTSGGKAKNCYWPMPFRRSARVTVTNDSPVRCDLFYWQVDWQKVPSLPRDTAYFHAMYRQEFPCVMGRNYVFADLVGRGHYVGTVLSVYQTSAEWFGEGNDFFFINGEREPRLRGTGTEDYFCDGWGLHVQSGPYCGCPLWEDFGAGNRGSAYRWHIPDPVPFTKSLRVEIEHKGWQVFPDGKVDGYIERDDLFSSVAFWYQLEPHKPYEPLPPGPKRLPYVETAVVEGEDTVATCSHSPGPAEVQELDICSGGKQLFFRAGDDKAWLEVPFTVDREQEVELWCRLIRSYDYGNYRALMDGQDLGVLNLYSPDIRIMEQYWGVRKLAAGPHKLRFECVGRAADSRGYFLGFDALVRRIAAYQRPPGKDLRDLQVKPRK